MEGSYKRVLSAWKEIPHEIDVYFMDLLAKNVIYEIARCSKRACDFLSLQDSKQILVFSSNQELEEYVTEEHFEWDLRNGCVFPKCERVHSK